MSDDSNQITDVSGKDRERYIEAFGARGVFAPGVPMAPVIADDEKPRVFDYMSGVNLYMTPRSGYGLLPFSALKNFAETSDAVRIVVEAIKREIRSAEWHITAEDPKDETDYSREIRRLTAAWRMPDGVTEFDAWCNAVLEDMLVYDAVSLWLDTDASGGVLSVEQIDGSTIRPLLDVRGRIPRPPTPGFMQYIKGRNWQWFTADRLLYRPFNTSAASPYGRSPIEFLILRLNESLRRQYSAAEYWSSTNVPEAMAFLPSEWSPENIRTFQDYFDTLLVGDIAKLRRIKFMPSPGGTPIYEFRRPDAASAAQFDEWMLKMTCWAFGFLPSELGLVAGSGLGGKGFMDGMENAQYRFGIGPIVSFLQNLFSGIVQRQTSAPLVWRFKDLGPVEDKQAEAQLLQTQLQNGIIDINVWRQKAGQPPIEGAEPFYLTSTGPVPLRTLFAQMAQQAAAGAASAQTPAAERRAPEPDAVDAAPEPEAQPTPEPDAPEEASAPTPGDVQNAADRVSPLVAKAVDASQDGWEPPQAVQRAAKMGLELRAKFGRGGTEIGVARARDLSNGKRIPPETINRMLSYFARHAVDAKADGWEDRANPSAGWIAWLLWGGDAGRDWVQSLERRYGKFDASEPEPEMSAFEKMALEHWREKALRRMKDGKRADCDPPAASGPMLKADMVAKVRRGLAIAGDVKMVSLVFKAVSDPKAFARPALAHEHVHEHGHAAADGLSKAFKLNRWEKKIFDGLKRIFDRARDSFARLIADDEPLRLDDLSDDMREELRPVLRDIMEEGIYGAEADVGVNLGEDEAPTAASEWAREYVGELVDGIDETTREMVGGVVADYLESTGVTIGDLQDQLASTFGESRAESIAVTETTRAAAAGQREYQKRAASMGVVTLRKNNTNNDDLVCPICSPLNQVTEDEWEDPEGPPWHPRCRCFVTLKVVVKPRAADDGEGEEGDE